MFAERKKQKPQEKEIQSINSQKKSCLENSNSFFLISEEQTMKEMTFKEYAKQAKQRMKSGFWQKERKKIDELQRTSTPDAVAAYVRDLHDKIYHVEKYNKDQAFLEKVRQIVNSPTLIINPLKLLIDEDEVKDMSPSEKQAYLMKLSAKYQQARERIEKEH